jgi:hypothetical protein
MVDAGRLVDLSSALRIDCRLSREAEAPLSAEGLSLGFRIVSALETISQ